ncbi:MAG: aminoglycoside phosphotransferase, partial [Pseudomonadota bacterium]
FQDALIGQSAYDAVSLLEDARRDVDPGLADELYQEERDQSSNPGVYAMDYAILAAQRNMKILGVFVRLAVRDKKPQYRDFLPRMHRHIAKDLDRPEAAPLREWTARYVPALLSNGEKP